MNSHQIIEHRWKFKRQITEYTFNLEIYIVCKNAAYLECMAKTKYYAHYRYNSLIDLSKLVLNSFPS